MTPEIRPLDRHFADFICRESGGGNALLWLASALLSSAVGRGDVCLSLEDAAGTTAVVEGGTAALPDPERLAALLQESPVVGGPGDFRPLILDGSGRLYLHRYRQYEQDLVRVIRDKAAVAISVCVETLRDGLARYFPGTCSDEPDLQKTAAIAALRKRFCIISGGPGTGKTSTVVKIIALLVEQQPANGLKIALAAPTGKAAARLRESISRMRENLPCSEEVRQQIPTAVSTIHRLLGTFSGTVRFRHSAENPLPHDIVIVDEASMIDLPLMAKLVTALRNDARLILLGDRDQLASVEAGAVLGDLCGSGLQEEYSAGFRDLAGQLTGTVLPSTCRDGLPGLTDSLVVLRKNYRFSSGSGIGALATAINSGDGELAYSLLSSDASTRVSWGDLPGLPSFRKTLEPEVVNGFSRYLAAETPAEALACFDSFRVLCALREGICGVVGLTGLIEEILSGHRLIDAGSRWYKGRPVMVTANDYGMNLFNGDVGIIFPDPDLSGLPRVWFPTAEGGIRKVSPVRLPAHETAYAMTVHKSQGSEFDRVLMILPDRNVAVVSRELLYTGISRAREEVRVWGDPAVFIEAVGRKIRRTSGVADALWRDTPQSER